MKKPEKKIISRNVHQLDAAGKIAGRFASEVAFKLIGKHKLGYQRYLDYGDFVVVANLDKLKFSGKKTTYKLYYRASGYPGGLKSELLGNLFKRNPEKLFRQMVLGMLPKNKLRIRMIKRLTFKRAK